MFVNLAIVVFGSLRSSFAWEVHWFLKGSFKAAMASGSTPGSQSKRHRQNKDYGIIQYMSIKFSIVHFG